MATYVQNTDVNATSGPAYNLADGDELYVGCNANVTTTASGWAAIFSNFSCSVHVLGAVFGNRGIQIGAFGGTSDIFVGAGASVLGHSGAEALRINGTLRLTNLGEIQCTGGAGYGLGLSGGGVLDNHGFIGGGGSGIVLSGSNATVTLNNTGVVQGNSFAISGGATAERIFNTGLLSGDVSLNSGDDLFHGVGGRLTGLLNGGSGSDTVSFAGHDQRVFVDLQVGLTFDGAVAQRTIDFENAVGTAFGDFFFGSAADNTFDAGPSGADFIGGYGGLDTVSYVSSIRPLIVDLSAQSTFDGVENDTLISVENATGSRFNDTIYGDAGANVIDGGPGGADVLHGLGGIDTLSFASSDRAAIIDLSANATWDGLVGDVISGFENATGSAFNDTIYGDGGANLIEGGLSVDSVFGGGGADRFVMGAPTPGNQDNVGDFVAGVDKLAFRLSDGYSASAQFVANAGPLPVAAVPTFLYNTVNGVLRYDADGTGGSVAEVTIATLLGAPALSTADLLFV